MGATLGAKSAAVKKNKPVIKAEGTVSAGSFDLHRKRPPETIRNFAQTIFTSHLMGTIAFSAAVSEIIESLDNPDTTEKAPGFMEKIWEYGTKILGKGAEILSGSEVAATFWEFTIGKVREAREKAEKAARAAEWHKFKKTLHEMEQAKEEGLRAENREFNDQVDKLVDKFSELGKANPEDDWKEGDRVALGAQAAFLKELDEGAKRVSEAQPTKDEFIPPFLVEWINSNHTPHHGFGPGVEVTDSGFIKIKFKLRRNEKNTDAAEDLHGQGGWFIEKEKEPRHAKLHCDKSEVVAEKLMKLINPFSVDKIDCFIRIDIEYQDGPIAPLDETESLPKLIKDQHNDTLELKGDLVDSGGYNPQYWNWIRNQTGQSQSEILALFTILDG